MKISVITVCYNSDKTIRDTIVSVTKQTHSQIEYIIIDGASTDSTLQIVAEYKDRIDHLVSEPDKGIYDAMNKGIGLATGEIICILNSDDIYSNDNVLENIVEQFQDNPNVDLVFGNLTFKDYSLEKLKRVCRFSFYNPAFLRFGWMPPHPATFVKRQVYEKFGMYSLEYKISADYEMYVKWLLVHKITWLHIPKYLVTMRLGGASTAGVGSSVTLNKEIVKACKTNGIYTNIVFVLSKIPFKLLELRF